MSSEINSGNTDEPGRQESIWFRKPLAREELLAKVVIRPATESDLPAMEWDGEYRHFRRLYLEIFQSTRSGRALMWLADLEGAGLVGQVFVQLQSGRPELADGNFRAYIYGFRVKKEFRRKGLGSHMLRMVEEDLRHRGIHWVTLNVSKDNPEARRLYERHHYRIVAEEPGRWSYYDDAGKRQEVLEPAWRMEKKLLVTKR